MNFLRHMDITDEDCENIKKESNAAVTLGQVQSALYHYMPLMPYFSGKQMVAMLNRCICAEHGVGAFETGLKRLAAVTAPDSPLRMYWEPKNFSSILVASEAYLFGNLVVLEEITEPVKHLDNKSKIEVLSQYFHPRSLSSILTAAKSYLRGNVDALIHMVRHRSAAHFNATQFEVLRANGLTTKNIAAILTNSRGHLPDNIEEITKFVSEKNRLMNDMTRLEWMGKAGFAPTQVAAMLGYSRGRLRENVRLMIDMVTNRYHDLGNRTRLEAFREIGFRDDDIVSVLKRMGKGRNFSVNLDDLLCLTKNELRERTSVSFTALPEASSAEKARLAHIAAQLEAEALEAKKKADAKADIARIAEEAKQMLNLTMKKTLNVKPASAPEPEAARARGENTLSLNLPKKEAAPLKSEPEGLVVEKVRPSSSIMDGLRSARKAASPLVEGA